jgi:hypothetical protein
LLTLARAILYSAAALIVLGGLYDLFVPKLPSKLLAACHGEAQACKLVRELLRALGGSLVAVGASVGFLVTRSWAQDRSTTLILILLLVVPSEGVNAFSMYRVGSPFLVPSGFIVLTLLGVILAWPGLFS